MSMTDLEIQQLLDKFLDNTMTAGELERFRVLVASPANRELMANLVEASLRQGGGEAEETTVQQEAIFQRILSESERIRAAEGVEAVPVREMPSRGKWWLAAASIILLLGTGAYFWSQSGNKKPEVVTIQTQPNDALPGKNGAILTLADGSQVVLDSLSNGNIATQNGAKVNLQDNQVIYQLTGEGSETVAYNTMTTPNGRQFQLMLPDGTVAWLNAASSISYPTVFTGKERPVKITGEVYFEVAKDAKRPFTVDINNTATVQVLGTHFNVNAYGDETAIRTTLLEGRVKVRRGETSSELQPGQQAVINDQSEKIQTLEHVNTTLVMAWKNGVFNFNGLSLSELMRQLSRWYDVEVVYTSKVPDVELYGKMGRDLNLSQVLQSLQEMDVRCRLEGKKLIVD